ncbi:MAG: VOC family protein [Myxococcota bacterium]|nr:VOC family protein [Myxococcota bacterium]
MYLRQIALVASNLDTAVDDLQTTLGLGEPFADKGVATFGLENAVFPIGETYLEVVSPKQENTTAGRLLERRGGDGGYMVIVQSHNLEVDRARIEALNIRIAWEVDLGDAESIHLHPRDTGGAILSIDRMDPPESWRWAGPNWETRSRTNVVTGIVGVTIQAENPEQMAGRWAEALGLQRNGCDLALTKGRIRFKAVTDGRGEGVTGLEVSAQKPEVVERIAMERGFEKRGQAWKICGVWIELV